MSIQLWDDMSLKYWFKRKWFDYFFLNDDVNFGPEMWHLKVGKWVLICPRNWTVL